MQSFYRRPGDHRPGDGSLVDRLREASGYRLAGGLLRLAATAFGAVCGFVFAFIWLHPFASLGLPLGGLAAWRLTAWMTLGLEASEAKADDEKGTERGSTALIYIGTGLMSAGILLPVLALPWLFGCTDECHAFAVVIVLGGLLAFIGASTLFFVADSSTIGESKRPWQTLLSQGWPDNPVHQFGFVAIGPGIGLISALAGLPLHLIPPVALVVTLAAICLRGWATLDATSQYDIWNDDRVLTQNFSFAIVTLWISIGVALMFIAVGWEEISARL
jgi:hypothetical protein